MEMDNSRLAEQKWFRRNFDHPHCYSGSEVCDWCFAIVPRPHRKPPEKLLDAILGWNQIWTLSNNINLILILNDNFVNCHCRNQVRTKMFIHRRTWWQWPRMLGWPTKRFLLFSSVSSSLRSKAPPVLSLYTPLDVRQPTFLSCSEFSNHQQCSSGQLTHTKHTNAKNNAVEIQSKFAIKYKNSCKYMKTLVPNATFSCDGAHAHP